MTQVTAHNVYSSLFITAKRVAQEWPHSLLPFIEQKEEYNLSIIQPVLEEISSPGWMDKKMQLSRKEQLEQLNYFLIYVSEGKYPVLYEHTTEAEAHLIQKYSSLTKVGRIIDICEEDCVRLFEFRYRYHLYELNQRLESQIKFLDKCDKKFFDFITAPFDPKCLVANFTTGMTLAFFHNWVNKSNKAAYASVPRPVFTDDIEKNNDMWRIYDQDILRAKNATVNTSIALTEEFNRVVYEILKV
jgi:hypothetical protein